MATSYLDVNGLARYHAGVKNLINQKVSEPASEGQEGYVLTTDGNGARSWRDISDVSSYAYVAAAKSNAEKCQAYAAAFNGAAYEIDNDGHLVIVFSDDQVTVTETDAEIATYAAHAEAASDTVESAYYNITNASLFLNTDGHLIVQYPSS